MEHLILKNKMVVLIDVVIVTITLLLVIYLIAIYGYNVYVGILIAILIIASIRAALKLIQPEILLSKDKNNLLIHGNADIKVAINYIVKIECSYLGLGYLFNYGSIIIHTANDTFVIRFVANVKCARENLIELIKHD